MINKMKYVWLSIVSAIFMLFMGCGSNADVSVQTSKTEVQTEIESVAEDIEELESEVTYTIDYDGVYTTKEDVALFIYTYDELPQNFITKKEAKSLGWEGGSLEPNAPGMCIGGDKFGNYEGLLPEEDTYKECDINTLGAKSRGAKRIVFSDDGDIYYTEDHYESFVLLYGDGE